MSRYKSATRTTMAERHFPVRVRVAVPQGGFGLQFDAMFSWLDQRVGKDRYWHGGGSRTLGAEAVCFYFLTLDTAREFVEQFGCELTVEGEWEAKVYRGT